MKRKRYFYFFLLFCLWLPLAVQAKEKVTLYFFYGNTCPHCEQAALYLEELQKQRNDFTIVRYETFDSRENETLLQQVRNKLGSDSIGVPFMVIGDKYLTGFAEYRKADILNILDQYQKDSTSYHDVVASVLAGENQPKVSDNPTLSAKSDPVDMDKIAFSENLAKIVVLVVIVGMLFLWKYRSDKKNRSDI